MAHPTAIAPGRAAELPGDPAAGLPREEVAPHHTAERRQWLTERAARSSRWQQDAYGWIDGDEGAIDAFRRALPSSVRRACEP